MSKLKLIKTKGYLLAVVHDSLNVGDYIVVKITKGGKYHLGRISHFISTSVAHVEFDNGKTSCDIYTVNTIKCVAHLPLKQNLPTLELPLLPKLNDVEKLARELAPKDSQDNPAYPFSTDTDIWIEGFKMGYNLIKHKKKYPKKFNHLSNCAGMQNGEGKYELIGDYIY